MAYKQSISRSIGAALLLAAAVSLAQGQAPKATLEQQLQSEYKITTPTADNTDLVITGSVLILQKKGFSAGAVSNNVQTTNTYKDGQIKGDVGTALRRCKFCPNIPVIGGAAGSVVGAAGTSRDFVNGEKLYVTGITVDRGKDTVNFDLISDSYGDAGRYKGSLKFVYPKGSLVSADMTQVDPVIAQVFKIAPADDQKAAPTTAQAAPAPVAAPPPPEAPPPPIAPPPPPPPDPPAVETKSLTPGQTKEQVEAILGKPDKDVKAGNKEIYQYKDMKVTFVNGKMTDLQ